MDLTAGENGDYMTHVYSVATLAQLNKVDFGLVLSKITLYWQLRECAMMLWQLVCFYQLIAC